jgi:hypothetical protein
MRLFTDNDRRVQYSTSAKTASTMMGLLLYVHPPSPRSALGVGGFPSLFEHHDGRRNTWHLLTPPPLGFFAP